MMNISLNSKVKLSAALVNGSKSLAKVRGTVTWIDRLSRGRCVYHVAVDEGSQRFYGPEDVIMGDAADFVVVE